VFSTLSLIGEHTQKLIDTTFSSNYDYLECTMAELKLQSNSNLEAIEKYRPLVIRFTKRDGSRAEYNIGFGHSGRDILLITACYAIFWCSLLAILVLLLKGSMDTTENHTLLWTFFIFGVIFVTLVGGAVNIGSASQDKSVDASVTVDQALKDITDIHEEC